MRKLKKETKPVAKIPRERPAQKIVVGLDEHFSAIYRLDKIVQEPVKKVDPNA